MSRTNSTPPRRSPGVGASGQLVPNSPLPIEDLPPAAEDALAQDLAPMTPERWLADTEPLALAQHARLIGPLAGVLSPVGLRSPSRRKVLLFGSAIVRTLLWSELGYLAHSRDAVKWVEAEADGCATCGRSGILKNARRAAPTRRTDRWPAAPPAAPWACWKLVDGLNGAAVEALMNALLSHRRVSEPICLLVRDLVGDPFLPALHRDHFALWPFDVTVQKLAQSLYLAHDFAGLPILADACEEAGCNEPRILDHLRQPGPHARGCWALDFLLGKE